MQEFLGEFWENRESKIEREEGEEVGRFQNYLEGGFQFNFAEEFQNMNYIYMC